MRGKAVLFRMFHGGDGITPAHAGKRKPTLPAERQTRDHPRACGEKTERKLPTAAAKGSPPRMRGKGNYTDVTDTVIRITPAHAGKRYGGFQVPGQKGDHPRACGEKSPRGHCLCYPIGSPPRMRGKACPAQTSGCHPGITPAHAGKSIVSPLKSLLWRDHPRACGEKREENQAGAGWTGSPPRMRGKALRRCDCGCKVGITPAHAGKRMGRKPTG